MKFDNTEEIEIVRLAIGKDSDAFVHIAGKAKGKLFQTACVILGSEAEACDAVDETMYNAYRGIRKLREPQFFTTWITRILINQCNKMLKRRKHEVAYDEMPEMTIEYFDKFPINEAVAKLPDELKTIISLRYFSDMTVSTIAELLSIPEGTVKTRQRKALSLLRVELEV
jgi:RNA polymerase sigma-70 factor (ECF subfamily)